MGEDIMENRTCPKCGSNDYKNIAPQRRYQLFSCGNCGYGNLYPPKTPVDEIVNILEAHGLTCTHDIDNSRVDELSKKELRIIANEIYDIMEE